MSRIRSFTVAAGAVLALAAPAFAGVPAQFTAKGVATSFVEGQRTVVENTVYYRNGRIRLEMAKPVASEGTGDFSVVLGQEGVKALTLLNPKEKQAMKLDAGSLTELAENPAMKQLGSLHLAQVAPEIKKRAKRVGAATVAGQPTTLYEAAERRGKVRMWLANAYDLPFKVEAYDPKGAKAFVYEVQSFKTASALGDAAFKVPSGYTVTDLSELLLEMASPTPARKP